MHQYLSKLVVEEPQSPDALWRMARACHDLAALETSKEEKKKLVYLAHDYAKKVRGRGYGCLLSLDCVA